MSEFIYKTGIQAYGLGVRLAAPFHSKAAQWVKGRKTVFKEMRRQLAGNTAPVIWFHCASLGEFEQGRPLMEAFRQQHPAYKVLLTFFSPSGYEVRKNYAGADYIFYLPLDTPANARQFIDLAQPVMAVFVKYEFWHYYTQYLKQRQIPMVSISAIFRPNQIYFKKNGTFYRRILERFTHIFTQNQESAELLQRLHLGQVTVAGDTRFDRVLQTAANAAPIPLAQAFKAEAPVMVVGSSWPEDLKVLLPFMQEQLPHLKFIIAPHEIRPTELAELEAAFPGQAIRYSVAQPHTVAQYRILLIDNVGMLSALYRYADYAYVGGAFGKGLHNTLEPAVFGPPVFFGPKYEKFQEAKDLLQLQVAYSLKNTQELTNIFSRLFQSSAEREKIRQAAHDYTQKQAGATARILTALEYWLPSQGR